MTFLHKLAQRLATCCFAVGALALVLAGCEKEGQRDFLAPSFSTTSTTSSATSTYSGKLSINPRKGQVGVSGSRRVREGRPAGFPRSEFQHDFHHLLSDQHLLGQALHQPSQGSGGGQWEARP